MTAPRTRRLQLTALLATLCAVAVSGCASWQAPRIDPSGQRFLVWPNEAPPGTVVVPPPAATIAPPPPAIVVPGNIQAAPVWPDPAPGTYSMPLAPAAVGPPVAAPALPAPPAAGPVAVGPPVPVGPAVPIAGQPSMRITPDRLLAPVGSEVILKAGICGGDGYLVPNERVEWLLAREGAGQIVDLAERDQWDLFRSWRDTPRKVDNWYAVGATSTRARCLHRGNADPSDDVQVLSGEAWVAITSPAEGTSYVTAYTPAVRDWQLRRATATIYWVDAQWVFPPSATVPTGQAHVLTTTVTRRTDGTPVAGWLVRYEVSGGDATLSYDAGNVTEVPTDASGRASVEVSPVGGSDGVTIINMVLMRPGMQGPDASPPLEIGRGTATVTWGSGAAMGPPITASPAPFTSSPAPISAAPGPIASGPAPITSAPPPTVPRDTAPGGTYVPPREPATAGQPDLEVRLSRLGPEEVTVGELARFQVVVTNRGTGTATKVELIDRFDRGLSHPQALAGEFAVKYPGMRDLAPGQSATVPLTFEVVGPGRHCHEVTVTTEGGEEAIDRMCVVATETQAPATPTLEVTKLGPTRQIVGELAKFKIVVKNTGNIAATNVQIVDQYDQALVPKFTEAGRQFLPDGRIQWTVDRFEAGERREFRVQCECAAPSRSACNRVIVKADGGANYAHEACLEILSPLGAGTPGTGTSPSEGNVRVTIVETANPVKAGQRTTVYVNIENTGDQAERRVEVWLRFPPELTPDINQIQPQGSFTLVGQEIRFSPIAELRAREKQTFVIPATANRTGSAPILARLSAANMAQATTTQSNAIEIVPGP